MVITLSPVFAGLSAVTTDQRMPNEKAFGARLVQTTVFDCGAFGLCFMKYDQNTPSLPVLFLSFLVVQEDGQ